MKGSHNLPLPSSLPSPSTTKTGMDSSRLPSCARASKGFGLYHSSPEGGNGKKIESSTHSFTTFCTTAAIFPSAAWAADCWKAHAPPRCSSWHRFTPRSRDVSLSPETSRMRMSLTEHAQCKVWPNPTPLPAVAAVNITVTHAQRGKRQQGPLTPQTLSPLAQLRVRKCNLFLQRWEIAQ